MTPAHSGGCFVSRLYVFIGLTARPTCREHRQEGIVRHERIMPDGRKRNSVRFSIIDEEWPQVREHLERKLTEYSTL